MSFSSFSIFTLSMAFSIAFALHITTHILKLHNTHTHIPQYHVWLYLIRRNVVPFSNLEFLPSHSSTLFWSHFFSHYFCIYSRSTFLSSVFLDPKKYVVGIILLLFNLLLLHSFFLHCSLLLCWFLVAHRARPPFLPTCFLVLHMPFIPQERNRYLVGFSPCSVWSWCSLSESMPTWLPAVLDHALLMVVIATRSSNL